MVVADEDLEMQLPPVQVAEARREGRTLSDSEAKQQSCGAGFAFRLSAARSSSPCTRCFLGFVSKPSLQGTLTDKAYTRKRAL